MNNQWQPIETAPSEEWVLVFASGAEIPDVSMFCQLKGEWGWCDPERDEYQPNWTVTHWMPLPLPPKE